MIQKDTTTTVQQLKEDVLAFVVERDWSQFHTPRNLATKISIEAGELLEKFVWVTAESSAEEFEKNRTEIEHELADVFICILSFCNQTGIDLTQATLTKLEEIKNKYPIEKSKGIAKKYTQFDKD